MICQITCQDLMNHLFNSVFHILSDWIENCTHMSALYLIVFCTAISGYLNPILGNVTLKLFICAVSRLLGITNMLENLFILWNSFHLIFIFYYFFFKNTKIQWILISMLCSKLKVPFPRLFVLEAILTFIILLFFICDRLCLSIGFTCTNRKDYDGAFSLKESNSDFISNDFIDTGFDCNRNSDA